MIFKRKGLIALASISLAFVFCCFNAHAHQPENEQDIGYEFEQKGEKNLIRFGPISKWLQKDYREGGALGVKLPELIYTTCRKYEVNAVIFDNIEYVYNQATQTLSITGHEGSLYATAQNFVIEGLGLTNACDMGNQQQHDVATVLNAAAKKRYLPGTRQYEIFVREELERIQQKRKGTPEDVVFKTKPLKTVIVRGNVIRLGNDFCNAHPNIRELGKVAHFPIVTLDLSQSNVREICDDAFMDCAELANVIPPINGSLQTISGAAFWGCPVTKSLNLLHIQCNDPRTSVNYVDPCACCCLL